MTALSKFSCVLAVGLVFAAACGPASTADPTATAAPATARATDVPTRAAPTEVPASPTPMGPMTLSSSAFEPEGDIPLRHAQAPFSVPVGDGSFVCPGQAQGKENLSPPLEWANVPPEARSLALTMADDMHFAYPDVPEGIFYPHWVIFNIPPTATGLPEGVPSDLQLADGSVQGVNGYPEPYSAGYGGPCPKVGERHMYIFTLYALDTTLDLPSGTEPDLRPAIEGHILASAELRAYYTGQ